MIGLYLNWDGSGVEASLATRFGASLAVGTGLRPHHRNDGGALFASAAKGRNPPIRLPSGEWVLFSGFIQNRAQLRAALGRSEVLASSPASLTAQDAALYAAAYQTWGDAADLRVIGEFATIIADPANRCVRIARSPLAGPPLHYFSNLDCLIVATTPRAIFATGRVTAKLNEQKIADSLALNDLDPDQGWFEGISRIAPGERQWHQPGRYRRDAYYDPFSVTPVRFKSDADYVAAADSLFREATDASLDGFSRPAVMISGGFDSQAVAHYALQSLPEPVRLTGYTAVPEAGWDGRIAPDKFGDESEHAQAFASMHPSFDLTVTDAAGLGLDPMLQQLFLLGSIAPRSSPNLFWIHEIHRRARSDGHDVLLTGARGNLGFSFSGAARLPDLMRRGQWLTLIRELNALRDGRSLPRKLAGLSVPLLPRWAQAIYARHRRIETRLEDYSAIRPEYAAEMRVHERCAEMGLDTAYRPPVSNLAMRRSMLEGTGTDAADLHQALSLLHGIPSRDPTAYRPFLEFCFAIPDDQYYRNGQSRWLARRLLRGKVPDRVLSERRRGKQGADWHLRMARDRDALIAEIDRLARDPAMAHRLDLPSLRQALEDWPAQTPLDTARSAKLNFALTRALTTARFIKYIEGTN